jgi:hypothetical protein
MSHRLCRAGLLVTACVLLSLTPSIARSRSHQHFGDGFSIDLDEPYDRVLQVIQAVTEDGVIRGTSEYRGTSELLGASPAKTSSAFKKPPAPGTVLYKVRAQTIAPDHFYDSNDIGTVAVRYVVKALGPKSTRLTIDAVFQQDNRHHYHASDGTVENAEFLAISDEIKDINDREVKQRQDAANAEQAQKLSELQGQLDQEREQLKAVAAKEQELQNKIQALQAGKPGHARTASADLKAEPYNQSKTLQLLWQGEEVTVLRQTRSWYRVQVASGERGWVYRVMLEVAQ